jgi:hypothetical protein
LIQVNALGQFNQRACDDERTEDLMQIRDSLSTSRDDLLGCRVAMLGLDLSAIESCDSEAFETIKRRCTSCDFREACELDLRRDPNNPVWETYCPNSATLIALSEAWWLTH